MELGGGDGLQFAPDMLTTLNAEIGRQSLMIAFLDDFYMLSWVLLAFVPLPLLLRKPRAAGVGRSTPHVE